MLLEITFLWNCPFGPSRSNSIFLYGTLPYKCVYQSSTVLLFSNKTQKKSGLKKNGDKNEETAFVRRRGPTDAIIPPGLDKEDWSSLFYHMDFCGTLISHNKKNLSQSCLPLYQISFFYLVITLL